MASLCVGVSVEGIQSRPNCLEIVRDRSELVWTIYNCAARHRRTLQGRQLKPHSGENWSGTVRNRSELFLKIGFTYSPERFRAVPDFMARLQTFCWDSLYIVLRILYIVPGP